MSEHKAKQIGVLVMSYGTPESMDDVETYYTHIRRGNAPTPELLAELKGRYEAIVGGVFPLRENTNGQVAGLQDKLEQLAPNKFTCYQGTAYIGTLQLLSFPASDNRSKFSNATGGARLSSIKEASLSRCKISPDTITRLNVRSLLLIL